MGTWHTGFPWSYFPLTAQRSEETRPVGTISNLHMPRAEAGFRKPHTSDLFLLLTTLASMIKTWNSASDTHTHNHAHSHTRIHSHRPLNKTSNNQCWRGCGEKATSFTAGGHSPVQPLWKTVL